MQRIFNFDDWHPLEEGMHVTLGDETSGPRVVVLEVNAEDRVKIFVTESGVENFLALCYGRDEVQFAVDGQFDLHIVGGRAHFKTAEAADWTQEPVDDQTFTTIVERRVRNPQLEEMMYLAQRNIESRLNAQFEERERRLQQQLNAAANARTEPPVIVAPAPVIPAPSAGNGGATGGTPEATNGAEPSGSTLAAPAPAGTS